MAPQPAYILFTSVFFAIIESVNFLARLLPALAGSALVFVPTLFKNKIGARPALILALLIAFDPGLVAISRQAGGTALAVTFLLGAWGFWLNRGAIAAGVCLALALLSGPSAWSGLLILLLTSLFLRGMNSKPAANSSATTSLLAAPLFSTPLLAFFLHPPPRRHPLLVSGERVEIHLEKLKALFFVKNYDGDKQRADQYDDVVAGGGRKIKVTFTDGETIIGYTTGYSPGRPGFYLLPADLQGNNERIFIITSATQTIELH